MKTRNIFSLLIAIVVLIASTQMALAYQVQTTDLGPYRSGSGGEFTLFTQLGTFNGGFDVSNYYSNLTQDIGSAQSFQTFCLERDEYIYTNTIYDAVFNQSAIAGGVNTNAGDPISKGTAWLYSQFAAGTLAGYNYGAGRSTSAGLLQDVIWKLEGEGDFVDESTNVFWQAVIAKFGDETTAVSDNNGLYSVSALNLYASGSVRQDMLVATPIPAAAWLLATGLVGMVAIRRRFKK